MAGQRDKRARQARREARALPSYSGRRYTVLTLFGLAAAALVWRAVDQQVLEKDFLQREGEDRYLTEVEVPAHRGLITDRRGDVLALSTPVDSVVADPRLTRLNESQAQALATVLDVDAEHLRNRLARFRDRHFLYLKKRLPPSDALHVLRVAEAHGIAGIDVERAYKRYYPTGEVFAHVLGFAGDLDEGQEGLELSYDDALRGKPGAKLVLRDGKRNVVDDVENIRSPRNGDHLALSLDRRLQFIAYRELKRAVRRHGAVAGSLVLLDVDSGEILAMVNQPSFNPNGDRSNRGGRLRNRAMTDVFEPGSTMKPFTVAAALDVGTIDVDSVIDTAPGYFHVGAARVRDKRNLGVIDIETLLRKSSNVGAGKIALELESSRLWEALDGLGLGRASDAGFPGEAHGLLHDFRQWARIDQATLSFGYGVSVTALQLAQAYAVIANDGLWRPTTLIKAGADGKGRRVFSTDAARQVRAMLTSVTTIDGTAPDAAVTGYRVSGKTGTVKKFGPEGYSDDRYLALFAGMAPADDPRLVMVVVIDEPQAGEYYGGKVAGPVFSVVMAEALRLLNVPPDAVRTPSTRLAQAGGVQ